MSRHAKDRERLERLKAGKFMLLCDSSGNVMPGGHLCNEQERWIHPGNRIPYLHSTVGFPTVTVNAPASKEKKM